VGGGAVNRDPVSTPLRILALAAQLARLPRRSTKIPEHYHIANQSSPPRCAPASRGSAGCPHSGPQRASVISPTVDPLVYRPPAPAIVFSAIT